MNTIEIKGLEPDFFEEYIKYFIMEEENLDQLLINHFPKDITNIIFKYVKPYCDVCGNCCDVCKLYCSLECLRYNNRDICCKGELNTELNRYKPPVLNILNETIETFDERTPLFNNDIRSDNY
tara:strand:- start:1049 stop:1417 length:369 start_codon:yes stop_codon:yes gene_type:complete